MSTKWLNLSKHETGLTYKHPRHDSCRRARTIYISVIHFDLYFILSFKIKLKIFCFVKIHTSKRHYQVIMFNFWEKLENMIDFDRWPWFKRFIKQHFLIFLTMFIVLSHSRNNVKWHVCKKVFQSVLNNLMEQCTTCFYRDIWDWIDLIKFLAICFHSLACYTSTVTLRLQPKRLIKLQLHSICLAEKPTNL